MGIKGLMKLIGDYSPEAVIEKDLSDYFSRKIAIDGNVALYSFLAAVRSNEANQGLVYLTDDQGLTTSHLLGVWSRCLKFLKRDIVPIFVFDGGAPDLKSTEIDARKKSKEIASQKYELAKARGDVEEMTKQSKRNIRVSSDIIEESMKLLELMGIPYIKAPCEAEAQCAELVKGGLVYAVGSEDMDTLTCGGSILLRNLNYSESVSKSKPVKEIHLSKVLEGLELNMNQFVDLCILCGCDYSEKIRGIGPVRALNLIKKYGSIEEILDNIDKDRYKVPEDFPYLKIREYFLNPEARPASSFKKNDLCLRNPDCKGILEFLVEDKGFSLTRVESGLKILESKYKEPSQSRITSFFGVKIK